MNSVLFGATTEKRLAWTVRVLALLEVIDAIVFLAGAGWFAANRILVGLVIGGAVGFALTWLRKPVSVVALGGLLVAVAPAAVYPLSIVLAIASMSLIVVLLARGFAVRRVQAEPR